MSHPAVPIIHHAGDGTGFLSVWEVLALSLVVNAALYFIFVVLPRIWKKYIEAHR